MHRSHFACAKAGPKRPSLLAAPITRIHAEAERVAALSAMRAEETYVARYRTLPRSSTLGVEAARRIATGSRSSTAAPSASSRSSRFATPDLADTSPKVRTSLQRGATAPSFRASSSSSNASSSTANPYKGRKREAQAEEDEDSWAFGGGVNSQGGPASHENGQPEPRSQHKIEFVVQGSAGKGAVPNYGRKKRYTHETEGLSTEPSSDEKIARQYRHEYAPTARSPRPLPHHTYFSTPSSSFNDDAAATAAGVGPVGVGGPRSGLGMGAGTHVLDGSAAITRKKSALILPGQGSQYVGMTDDIFRKYRAARQVWSTAEEALVYSPKTSRQLQGLINNDAATPEQRQRFEDELEKSVEWDTSLNRLGSGTAVARSRRGWLRDLVFTGDQLNLTRAENAQPSILASSLSILSVLRQEFPVDLIANHVDYVAGHGSGVYAALCAAGSLDLRDGVRLLRHRGLTSTHFVQKNKTLFPNGCQMPESIYETWAFANAGR